MQLYGNPGTAKGRSKGGLASIATHRLRNTGFILRKKITRPRRDAALAEFIGIVLGDGHVGTYQTTISTSTLTDMEHARYIQKLAESLFSISAPITMLRNCAACVVVISSKKVCDFLKKECLPHGNKVRDGIIIPPWIRRRKLFTQRCARGLFDTDGSIYLDIHRRPGREYRHMGMAFANKNRDLLSYFYTALTTSGLHPTQTTPFRVSLRRKKDIDRYFEVIGSSNPKHLNRYAMYSKGRVA
jgi:hypothetical protein